MCPTGHCFTPHVNIKKSIDLFGETQACEALGIEVDVSKKTATLFPTPAAFIRISPIAYFYAKHSPSKRREVLQDFVGRIYGKHTQINTFIDYLELLVNALNGLSKDEILGKVDYKLNSNNLINKVYFDLIDLLSNDQNNIEEGIRIALEKTVRGKNEFKYLNPFDSDQTILLTLYLQIAGAIYNNLPENCLKNIHAKETIDCLSKWIIYQRNQNLNST